MRRTWHRAKPKDEKKFRVNNQITALEVFLIGEEGEQIGNVKIGEALRLAREAESDLVEVNPKGDVPIVKIMDYGQFRYEQEKKAHKQKVQQKKIDIKGVRLSVRISRHDFSVRIEQAAKFLEKGDKLKIEIILKGREKQHPEKAAEIINEFVKELKSHEGLKVETEQGLTKQGGRFTIVLINKND